ncbi:MAG: site-2 protease family protein [Clostridiales bacterium]|jgi:stage IV sporulation protein FB|nr:site-2 protease family protein [Clostridiales bacterium]
MIKIGKFSISYAFIFMLMVSFFGRFFDFFLIAYTSAIIHEFFHIMLAKIFKVKILSIEFLPFGITAKLENSVIKEPNIEIIIACAGPISNILILMILFIINKYFCINKFYYDYAFVVNIFMFILNMLPIIPLDGGRILRALLTKSWGILKSYNFLIKLSYFFSSILIIVSLFLLLTSPFNFSLILIGSFLLGNLTVQNRQVNLIFLKEILNSNNKLSKSNINKIKFIAVFDVLPAIKILKHFTYNSYYVIKVLDKNMKIINTLTETQVVNSILKFGANIKCGKINI